MANIPLKNFHWTVLCAVSTSLLQVVCIHVIHIPRGEVVNACLSQPLDDYVI